MITTATLGFPRIGPQRELKKSLDAHWAGRLDVAGLEAAARSLRRRRWETQRLRGISVVPSNDFSLYDHVLDACCLVRALPERFAIPAGRIDMAAYFRCARGSEGVQPLEMTKWFDTNYHYLVPEFTPGQRFIADASKPFAEFLEAKALGLHTRPVLLGPVSFLRLGKLEGGGDPLTLLPSLLPAYASVLADLISAGADWVQIDEPCLATDLTDPARQAYHTAYAALAGVHPRLRLMLTTYFGGLDDNLALACSLPVAGLHLDLIRAPHQLDAALPLLTQGQVLSLGVIDGRNVWRGDLDRALQAVATVRSARPDLILQVAPSCSLLHVPVDVQSETALTSELRAWLAFAVQKLEELDLIGRAANGEAVGTELTAARQVQALRRSAPGSVIAAVRDRCAAVGDHHRVSPFAERAPAQQRRLRLPAFPTTTIGSFPQTTEVRARRAAWRRGTESDASYGEFLRQQTVGCLHAQEEAGLDVLVHGEFERNDMVEHFGELLAGYAVTRDGWVQSYGSRCVKPPIIVGDVHRPKAMTVEWARFAQQHTTKPVKGMLTGPVTMLQWAFVRDDLPRAEVCQQIALALRDEVLDLEAAGIAIIQVDEPAFREGLPLRHADRAAWLGWAVDCFRLATDGVRDDTQIHTHMCYSEFNDIVPAIAALDADVISIETARSRMELLAAFTRFAYPNAIGPGLWDIHAPQVPAVAAMGELLRRAQSVLPPERLWINPDCGLKTRHWTEVRPALHNLVAVAKAARGG